MSLEQQQGAMMGGGSTPLEVAGSHPAWALFDNVHRVAKEDVKVGRAALGMHATGWHGAGLV